MSRRSLVAAMASAVLALGGCALTPERPGFLDDNEAAVYGWLCAAQGTNGFIGLEGQGFDSVYSMSMSAFAHLLHGDVPRAERVFDFFTNAMPREFTGTNVALRGFVQFHRADGTPMMDTIRWVGDNSWLLLALNYYRDRTGSAKYDAMAWAIADWLDDMQDRPGALLSDANDGAIWYGFDGYGTNFIRTKSVEGTLDAWAALRPYAGKEHVRDGIRRFLDTMYHPDEKRLQTGHTWTICDSELHAWAFMALLDKERLPMDFVEKDYELTVVSDVTGQRLTGFAFMPDDMKAGRLEIAPTIEIAAAYYAFGNRAKGDYYLREIEKAMVDSTDHPGTRGFSFVANKSRYPNDPKDLTRPAAHSSSWYLIARRGLNPLQVGTRPVSRR